MQIVCISFQSTTCGRAHGVCIDCCACARSNMSDHLHLTFTCSARDFSIVHYYIVDVKPGHNTDMVIIVNVENSTNVDVLCLIIHDTCLFLPISPTSFPVLSGVGTLSTQEQCCIILTINALFNFMTRECNLFLICLQVSFSENKLRQCIKCHL